ncbi:Holliday junction DNA helicase RuvA [Candidatus Saccharibacteria bacterium 47-87]|nr:Holliday junction branch migration protein RuvA [Candidatus Saccharibacteria bacterium]OJU97339.1 MAG: Holliday junction DNA helicase RuvA [Candidatus Saccharibacteria bacterium 47-87]
MIAHVSGVVAEKFGSSVIVDVHDIGYEVQVAASDFDQSLLGEPVKFYTYHHIREQSQELFGFSSLAAKKLFELLITVQGVGPKAALSILSVGDSEQVRNAIANSDSGFVAKANGVGKKIAERVVVDLSDKVGLPVAVASASGTTVAPAGDEALEALMALGYTLQDAMTALEGVPKDASTAERVTLALRAQ